MNPRIEIRPAVCHGKPVFKGTRVLVSTVLGALGGGDPMDTVLEDFPSITREDVEAALEFASQVIDRQVSTYDTVA